MSDSKIIDIHAVMNLTSKSKITVYRWIGKKILPKPFKINNRLFWNEADIFSALDNLANNEG